MLSPSDEALVRSYAARSLQMAHAGQFLGFLGTLTQIGQAAADPRLYSGDAGAVRAMALALGHFESQCSLSDPFVGLNATWRPSNFLADPMPVAESMISKTVRTFDRTALLKFFTVLDQEIERSGPATELGALHQELRGEHDNRYTLLDPFHDARISDFPRGRGSRPGVELYLAAKRAGTLPDIGIGSHRVDLHLARGRGFDLDLGRIEALELLSGAAPALPTDGGVRPARHQATSLEMFNAICERYEAAASAKSNTGLSLWFRGQGRSYRFPDVLGLTESGWTVCRRRIGERLTHLEDDDLLIASAFRRYEEFWQSPEQIGSVFASLGAWQLIAQELMQNDDLFPVAPEVILPEVLTPQVRDLLAQLDKDPFGTSFQAKMTAGVYEQDGILLPEATQYAIIDGKDQLLFRRRHRFDKLAASGSLLLQHYGCPTGGLDITRDRDVALAFAAGSVSVDADGRFVRVKRGAAKPVVYLMLLHEARDPFLCSEAMFKGANHPNRIEQQKCGILFGSSSYCRNYAFRHVVARIEIDFELPESLRPEEVYPRISEDPLSARICERFPEAYKLASERICAGGNASAAPGEPRFRPTFRL
ncbi:hypothetical protein [Roseomonas sp. USHLN139]|uniref:hypothetical protein n=1 Tax=Roseomonas sp. USHLN139 TaxID=3081298 RepID=UPI003B0171D3